MITKIFNLVHENPDLIQTSENLQIKSGVASVVFDLTPK